MRFKIAVKMSINNSAAPLMRNNAGYCWFWRQTPSNLPAVRQQFVCMRSNGDQFSRRRAAAAVFKVACDQGEHVAGAATWREDIVSRIHHQDPEFWSKLVDHAGLPLGRSTSLIAGVTIA